MVLDADYSYAWESTLNHEISHLIDQRLAFRSYYVKDAVYNEETWNSYNPEAFSYSYTYVGYETSTLYDAFSDYCKGKGLSVDELLCDGLHPNDKGYKVMFNLIIDAFGV